MLHAYYYAIGVTGMILILLGWIISFKSIPPPILSGLYSLGSFVLAVYSILIKDVIFTTLNILAMLFSGVQFYRGLRRKWSRRRDSNPRPPAFSGSTHHSK